MSAAGVGAVVWRCLTCVTPLDADGSCVFWQQSTSGLRFQCQCHPQGHEAAAGPAPGWLMDTKHLHTRSASSCLSAVTDLLAQRLPEQSQGLRHGLDSKSCLVHGGYHGSALQADAAEEGGDVRPQGLFCVLDRRLVLVETCLWPEEPRLGPVCHGEAGDLMG